MKAYTSSWAVRLTIALAALAAAAYAWQGDTPIIIGDGSLTMESVGVPWRQFSNGTTRRRGHPHTAKAVTSVEIVSPGNNRTITFAGEHCAVTVHYASTDIVLETANNGRGLTVSTDFDSFQQGADERHLAHKDAHSKISRVTVVKGNQTVYNATPSGGTKVTVHYQ